MSVTGELAEFINQEPHFDLQSRSSSIRAVSTVSETFEPTKSRPQRSWVWKHAVKPSSGQQKLYNTAGAAVWKCSHCRPGAEYVLSGGTRAIREHLSKVHQMTEDCPPKDAKRKRNDEDIQVSIARMKDVGERIKSQRLTTSSDSIIDPLVLRELFVNWLAADSLPFSLCKSRAFRAWLHYVNPAASDLLPESDSTIRQDVLECHSRLQADVKQRLQSALSSVHITCDLWTSANRLGLLGVVAHCVDEDGVPRCLTLALREVEGAHSGENMASVLFEVLCEYQISTKLGYCTMDNASNNDTMSTFLESHLQQAGVDWDAQTHRLRCNGHVIHLAVQAFLFGHHPGLSDDDKLSHEDLVRWRQVGPLGKLHNIVVWIQQSPQRLQAFKKDSGGRAPRRDNTTRWNSWFEMLDWASKTDVRLAIEKASFSAKSLYNDRLSDAEWATLDKIRGFLGPFKDATMATQGQTATLEHVLPSMDFLLQHFEDGKTNAVQQDDTLMVACIETGWAKLIRYYNLTDRSAVYVAAIVLNPRWKFEYFTGTWASAWIDEAKHKVRALWEDAYQSTGISRETVSTAIGALPQSAYQAWISTKMAPVNHADEFSRYLSEPCLPHIDSALQWWVQQRGQYPALALMAIDILSIPGMSDEPERVFSGARHTVTDFRGSLKAESIEMLACIRSWRRAHLIG